MQHLIDSTASGNSSRTAISPLAFERDQALCDCKSADKADMWMKDFTPAVLASRANRAGIVTCTFHRS